MAKAEGFTARFGKKVDGLYFIGEVLDVGGEVGGYNFQWAFSSASICAKSLLSYNKN